MKADFTHRNDLVSCLISPWPERIALVSEERRWLRGDLRYSVYMVRQALRARGVRAGHRIAIALPAGNTALTTLLGAISIGAFTAWLSPALGPEARRMRFDTFRPDIVIDQNDGIDAITTIHMKPSSVDYAGHLVLWTSGSSGMPRGVVLDCCGILWNARMNAFELGIDSNDRTLVILDGAYCYALIHQIFTHLISGGSVAIPPQPVLVEETGHYIKKFEPTTLAVVPSVLRSLLLLPRLREALTHLRLLTVGGAMVKEELLRSAQDALPNVQIIVTYGLTEAGPRVATRLFRSNENVADGTVGRTMPGVELRIDHDHQIFIRSPSVRVGILHEDGVHSAPPWLATGDLGEIQDNGTLRFVGRIRPMINRSGFKIAPGEIERVLCSDPGVLGARVIAIPHVRLGEVPKALIVPRIDAPPTSVTLARQCFERLGAHWVPEKFEFVSALPAAHTSWKEDS